jgi:hypothetical protein
MNFINKNYNQEIIKMLFRNITTLRRGFIEVKSFKEFEIAKNGKSGYILQFSAAWCGPCKQLSPLLYKKE